MTHPILRQLSLLLLGGCLVVGLLSDLKTVSGQDYNSRPSIEWEKDINAAVAKAKETNRLVFIHFYGDACPPCKAMDADVFTQRQVIDKMNQHFVPVRVDSGLNPALVRQFEIKAIPSDVILKSDGKLVHRRQGGISADRFAVYLDYIDNEVNSKNTAVAAAKPVVPPTPPAPEATQSPVTTYQTMEIRTSAAQPAVVQTPIAQPAVPQPVVVATEKPQPAGPNPWDIAVAAPQTPAPQAPNQPLAPPPAPTNLLERNNPVRMSDVAATSTPAISSDATAGSTVEIPLALDGFCPVTLSTLERWVPGNPLFYAMYRGQIFRCANEETLATFIKEPAKYAPVAMGEDIVQMVERNKKVPGMRKFGAWFQNRVFLFGSQESLDSFAAKPDFYAEIAQKYETALRTRFDSVQR